MSQGRQRRLGPTRAEVLHHLRAARRSVSAAEVAADLGVHPNTSRFHLEALTTGGLVIREAEQRRTPGRPKVLYRASRGPTPDRYQDLAEALVRHFAGPLRERAELAREAGRAWGEELRAAAPPEDSPLQRLLGGMADLGYQPGVEAGDPPLVVLRPCPYHALAGEDPSVVCQLHLGLVRGLLGPDQPLEVTGIRPWVTADRCEVALAYRPTDPAGPDDEGA